MRIVITLTGAVLLIQAIKMVLPLGNVGKYVTFALGLFFMAVTLDALGGLTLRGEEVTLSPSEPVLQTQLEEVQQKQILQQYELQLSQDMRKSIPALSDADFSFKFSDQPFGQVTQLTIHSPQEKNDSAILRLSELYGIPREVIVWE